ncbi:hypothetical protein FACS1894164_11040 [Spirochaetia bacterium]|nr:hypothetical protein FACS1894164_11040 [Spirochaetia bacterium]
MDVTVSEHKIAAVQLGDNEYETGVITIAAGATVVAGTVLKRSSGKFAAAGSTDTALIAIVPFDLKNTGSAAADISFRALISGKVRADMLNIAGAALTDAQRDSLRDYGIIAKKIHNISRVET